MGQTRSAIFILSVLCIGIVALPLAADEGELKDQVIQVLEANANGECREDLMEPMLLDACEQQLPVMQRRLKRLGPIKGARYRGTQTLPNGIEAEIYRVIFKNGSMTWGAAAGSGGKLQVMFSQG